MAADLSNTYPTPKIDVRAVVIENDKMLFVRETDDGLWSLPGGYADINLSPSEAVEKEVLEEAGFVVKATRLLALHDMNRHGHAAQAHHFYQLFFLCEILSRLGSLDSYQSNETDRVQFFSVDELPEFSPTRVTRLQVLRIYELCSGRDIPVEFD